MFVTHDLSIVWQLENKQVERGLYAKFTAEQKPKVGVRATERG